MPCHMRLSSSQRRVRLRHAYGFRFRLLRGFRFRLRVGLDFDSGWVCQAAMSATETYPVIPAFFFCWRTVSVTFVAT
ncbi:hypothetical protein NEOLEDRAFT_1142931 [Neolentinus lepideus HHB14362 ss-1]|uniref:Uncharacterized protein n=1 Tax=Neolentinus lepideus HHB14362 ss-1 TaxID=1314782 RepID=A0A165MTS7_9AGAM|nr:hypothetical protein NEOLEDRAFT_1142931 [Neolentinus lepideus HHB14362 ss-1]